MGMYDDITTTLPCQKCGEDVSGFQSKDGPCVLAKLTPEQLFEEAGSGACFYTPCESCKFWNEWTFEPPSELRIVPVYRPHHPIYVAADLPAATDGRPR